MDESQRIAALHKERQQLELAKLKADSGLLSDTEAVLMVEGMEWMYSSKQDAADTLESYKLGRAGPPIEPPTKALQGLGLSLGADPTSSLYCKSLTKTDSDTLRKLREDPLFIIQQAEAQEQRKRTQDKNLREHWRQIAEEKGLKPVAVDKRRGPSASETARNDGGDASRDASRDHRRGKRASREKRKRRHKHSHEDESGSLRKHKRSRGRHSSNNHTESHSSASREGSERHRRSSGRRRGSAGRRQHVRAGDDSGSPRKRRQDSGAWPFSQEDGDTANESRGGEVRGGGSSEVRGGGSSEVRGGGSGEVRGGGASGKFSYATRKIMKDMDRKRRRSGDVRSNDSSSKESGTKGRRQFQQSGDRHSGHWGHDTRGYDDVYRHEYTVRVEPRRRKDIQNVNSSAELDMDGAAYSAALNGDSKRQTVHEKTVNRYYGPMGDIGCKVYGGHNTRGGDRSGDGGGRSVSSHRRRDAKRGFEGNAVDKSVVSAAVARSSLIRHHRGRSRSIQSSGTEGGRSRQRDGYRRKEGAQWRRDDNRNRQQGNDSTARRGGGVGQGRSSSGDSRRLQRDKERWQQRRQYSNGSADKKSVHSVSDGELPGSRMREAATSYEGHRDRRSGGAHTNNTARVSNTSSRSDTDDNRLRSIEKSGAHIIKSDDKVVKGASAPENFEAATKKFEEQMLGPGIPFRHKLEEAERLERAKEELKAERQQKANNRRSAIRRGPSEERELMKQRGKRHVEEQKERHEQNVVSDRRADIMETALKKRDGVESFSTNLNRSLMESGRANLRSRLREVAAKSKTSRLELKD